MFCGNIRRQRGGETDPGRAGEQYKYHDQEIDDYDHLEGWEGDARGRGYGDICICIAD